MTRITTIIIFFTLFCSISLSQNEQDIWYSGQNGTFVDFTGGTPVVTCLNNLNASEGSAMYCDPSTGNLLIYTNGQQVNNGSHNMLSNGNGLNGNSTSTETAMILPKSCGDLDNFFIFTNDTRDVYWSEANLSLGTDGTIDAGTKNTLLQSGTGERLGCAPHGSGTGGWIILTAAGGIINSYYFDASGINTTPVVSNTTLFSTTGMERGSIIISEDFTKLVISVEFQGVYFCDFDINTGLASNFNHIGPSTNGFSACFSPDGSKIYWTNGFSNPLYQYDIATTTNTQLDLNMSGVKLGPDGIVYTVTFNATAYGTISSPNTLGLACNYTPNALSLNGCNGSWSLPNQSINTAQGSLSTSANDTICMGESASINATASSGLTLNWSNGLGAVNSHTVSPLQTTIYYVSASNGGSCSINDSVIVTVEACETNIEMPNVFSPNNDQANDLFLPIEAYSVKSSKLKIFNRWGSLIYENTDALKGWDGYHNGNLCTEGTYYWIVEYTDFLDANYSKTGFVSLKH